MIQDWLLLLVALAYVALLFAVAYTGDRHPSFLHSSRLRAIVYSLTLVVYCSSWTFYGAVGTAARDGLAYLPIYLGPALLFLFGTGFLRRLLRVVRRRKITSIADFIGARFGKSHGLAALVTVIAVVAVVPYIALQFKAVTVSLGVLGGSGSGADASGGIDGGLWCAVLLAAFAILFGTRSIDATKHHHGLVLAVALESLIKLTVFVIVAAYALHHGPGLARTFERPVTELSHGLPSEFVAQTLLAALAMFCLPRQFQVGMVECEDDASLRRARWLLPLYMAVISVAVLPIVAAGAATPRVAGGSGADTWMLTLPMTNGSTGVALLAFIGGFSAATGMVIVASVALSIMISNDLVMPALLHVHRLRLGGRGDLSRLVIAVRGAAIVIIAMLAYAYYRSATSAATLAAIGLLAFAAVAQFAPALIAALYWRGASRRGVMVGLAGGFAIWVYTLLLPTLIHSGAWLEDGPFGWAWLRPHALFALSGWGPLMHGLFWSLLVNAGGLVFFSLRFPPSLGERLDTAAFLGSESRDGGAGNLRGPVAVADLRTIAERIVGERGSARAFEDYARQHDHVLHPADKADRTLIQYTERLLASAVGAANARRILVSALSGHGLDVAEAVALLDEASQELRFNRDLLTTILGNVAQGISVIDADMRLVAWNRRYLELFDYPDGMVRAGTPVSDLIRWNAARGECGPGHADALVARRVEHMRAGTLHVFEHVRADGAVIEMRGRALPGGGYVTTYSDVTSYKRAEQALVEINETLERRVERRTAELSDALADTARARRAAEAANASKSRFLAAASHDLVQPLNAARLFTSALRAQPGLDPGASELAERIDASFRATEGLLEALLDISRLDAGGYQPEIGDFALAGLFDSLRTQFAVVAGQRGLRLRVVPTTLAVRSDPQLLRRIAQNFVSNALRYTSKGGAVLGARRVGREVRVEVWDSGPGIAAGQHARIFEEFQRLEQPSPWGEQGLGLGLSICKRLAGILGCRLELKSHVGRGSCFAVTVPRAEAAPAKSERVERGGAGRQLPLTVLCVDNDVAILDGMTALLGRWGVNCRVAQDVPRARAELERGSVDVILVDYHLACDVDGLQAMQQLRGQLGGLPPVVMITADASGALKQRAQALGYPVLQKPVRLGALRAVLAAFVRG